ncbi:hypothetical protein ABB37_02504 [Leptomonas pyrrhocoris]|uniref:Uncharacterized protein n=1 Tax=Leptomonas pyrrhocoris TaxID=157538 RepID=A0A0N0VGA9_LEPPY|nr:hypothetical protein ABB37_02504 [Leptomonas pyrrhocoris]XP_015661118.1 hypothetical protein ABB37_02504 [Leptomonas pyrrhocoris]KPA82678.1 hypothetical protein ABB37_02504 [Leptomonas pyrrhocoris]KPA82679.1 hypothetical protein ABB37_02504 [Leptomonas pyrrhocoris]|eukprot:XP_015661117.1 hypothetical protein ABB37_02504 [Leptomonas pyrrhocoris]
MSTPFAASEWGTSPPFRLGTTPRLSAATSAVSKGSSGAHRGSQNGAAATWNGSTDAFDAIPYAADALKKSQNDNNGALVACAAGTGYDGALVKPTPMTTMAVAVTYPSAELRQSTFSGLYDDVDFPVHTLFTPPRPPGELLPRARRPNRNKALIYATDISRAGAREHNAQREVSRVWRGVLCRRRLRLARELENSLNGKARMIQCWWRSLQAKWRFRQLSSIRSGWAKERMARYVGERVLNTTNVIYWQHSKYEGAALRIQRVLRWYLREKERRRCAEAKLPESAWPSALVKPTAEHPRPYFPWRRTQSASAKAAAGALVEAGSTDADGAVAVCTASPARRTLLQFRDTPLEVLPPPQEEVERINAKMRERQAQRAAALQTPEAMSRRAWKTEGMRQEDLDFNAGVVQRLYRTKRVPETVHTKELTAAYFNKTARVIARTFRMYVLIKRMRAHREATAAAVQAKIAQRSAAKIEELKTEAVWQKDLMDAAATSIQRCWTWYRYRHDRIVPAAYRSTNTVPAPPCYGLIEAHMGREHALRWSTMNLLEKREYEEQRQHRFLRYTPKTVERYEHGGFFVVQTPSEALVEDEAEL